MRIVVSGGWSYGNTGDEAIAASTIYLINKYFPVAEKIYTSYDVKNFRLNHSIDAIASVHAHLAKVEEVELRFDDIYEDLDKYSLREFADLFDKDTIFIMSGGGYFHEQWKSQFIARILEVEIAKAAGAKVFVIGQSIGPVYSNEGKRLLKNILNKTDYLAIRDTSSYNFLNSLNLDTKVNKVPDLAIIISDIVKKDFNKKENHIISMMPASYTSYVGIDEARGKNRIVEKLKKRLSPESIKYKMELKKFIKYISCHEGWKLQFVLSTSWGWDKNFVQQLAKGINSKNIKICESETYTELCENLMMGDITVSTKMHPLIISTSYGIPTIGISYNYKVDDFMDLIQNSDSCFRINETRASKLIEALNRKCNSDKIDCDSLKKPVYSMFELLSQV